MPGKYGFHPIFLQQGLHSVAVVNPEPPPFVVVVPVALEPRDQIMMGHHNDRFALIGLQGFFQPTHLPRSKFSSA